MKDKVTEELKRVFRPEFLNRIDSQVVFHTLSQGAHPPDRRPAALRELEKQLLLKGVTLELTDAAKDWLGEKGYDHVFGARPLRRVIQNELEDRLSDALLGNEYQPGDRVLIDVIDGTITLKKSQEAEAEAEAPALT